MKASFAASFFIAVALATIKVQAGVKRKFQFQFQKANAEYTQANDTQANDTQANANADTQANANAEYTQANRTALQMADAENRANERVYERWAYERALLADILADIQAEAKFRQIQIAINKALSRASGRASGTSGTSGIQGNTQDDQPKLAKPEHFELELDAYDMEQVDASPARKEPAGSSWIAAGFFSLTVVLAAAVALISWNMQTKRKATYKKALFSEK